MILEGTLNFQGAKGQADLVALLVSGATYSRIHPDWAATLALLEALPKPLHVVPASEGIDRRIAHRVSLDFYLDGIRLTDEFMVAPALPEQTIIGATTRQKWRIKLDFDPDRITVDPRATKLKLM